METCFIKRCPLLLLLLMVNVSDQCSCFMPLYIFRSELGHVTWPGDGGQWKTLKETVFLLPSTLHFCE